MSEELHDTATRTEHPGFDLRAAAQVVGDLARVEREAVLCVGPRRKWSDLQKLDEEINEAEQASAALSAELAQAFTQRQEEDARHTAELAAWLENGSRGDKPTSRAERARPAHPEAASRTGGEGDGAGSPARAAGRTHREAPEAVCLRHGQGGRGGREALPAHRGRAGPAGAQPPNQPAARVVDPAGLRHPLAAAGRRRRPVAAVVLRLSIERRSDRRPHPPRKPRPARAHARGRSSPLPFL